MLKDLKHRDHLSLCLHKAQLQNAEQVDDGMPVWIKEAYKLAQ